LQSISLKRRSKKSKFTRKFGEKKRFKYEVSLNFSPAVIMAIILVSVFLLGGGFYLIMEKPQPFIMYYGKIYPVIPGELSSQTLSEGLASMLFLGMGVAGAYLGWRGTILAPGRRISTVKVMVGVVLMVLAAAGLYLLFQAKI
jgi:hypothetical protein